MTTGALIFAYNNKNIDYLSLAAWSADNIHRHLDIPVAVITDGDIKDPTKFDRIIVVDRRLDHSQRNFADAGLVEWHNTNRMDAYGLTPWDRTLLLDADYVIAGDSLKTLLTVDQDILTHRSAYDVTSCNDFSTLNNFGPHRTPMYWATVVMFCKSLHAQLMFESMTMIRDHWRHYQRLHGLATNSMYRNDYALTIAQGIVNGHVPEHSSIPWNMATVLPEHRLTRIDQDHYRVDYVDSKNAKKWVELKGQDFHAMGKKHLGDIVASSGT